MLLDDLDTDDKRRLSVDQILSAGFRARDLVRQLLAFSRKQTLEYKPIHMNKAIKNFEKLLRRTIREDIVIKINTSPDIQMIMADIGQIEQVIMNLAVNAADAMPQGGFLSIETAPVDLDKEYAEIHQDVKPGEYLMLAFSDTGFGMDEETRKQVFEPFFSTKGEQGTGLGLATVYGIVKQHGGNIWVYSEPGKGTTFKVYLPVSKDPHVEEKSGENGVNVQDGSETILLVEDNEQVRYLAHTILERRGYTVLVAESGPKALEILTHYDDPVHLLLTDVVMPEMNGKELFDKVAEKYPDLQVLYMSGYTNNVIAHRGVLDEGVQFVHKPFSVQVLSARVREMLDKFEKI
jgi:CheY-like chemotaxis protein/two-component sensor histidine kinase